MKYKYNDQWVDLSIKALDSMEIGCIIQYMGNTIPNGWLECNGASISQSTYPELYDLIGGTLPDFRGRVLVGQDTSQTEFDTLGETGGSKYLQEHTHNVLRKYKGSGFDTPFNESCSSWNLGDGASTSAGPTSSTGTGNSGNLQPYAVVKHIIKAVNTTPTMASIVNGYSTSTQDGYSCEYINGINTYSTTEVDTGKKWINGKKIYRKVIETTIGNVETALDALNCDFAVDLKGWYKTSYGFMWLINSYNGPDNENYSCRIYRQTSGNFKCQSGSYATTSNDITIIIEYTKTTDNSNTRSIQNSVSEEENFEDIEPIEEPIENELKDENR